MGLRSRGICLCITSTGELLAAGPLGFGDPPSGSLLDVSPRPGGAVHHHSSGPPGTVSTAGIITRPRLAGCSPESAGGLRPRWLHRGRQKDSGPSWTKSSVLHIEGGFTTDVEDRCSTRHGYITARAVALPVAILESVGCACECQSPTTLIWQSPINWPWHHSQSTVLNPLQGQHIGPR